MVFGSVLVGEIVGKAPGCPSQGDPRGLLVYRDGCYIHSSVYAWSPVTRSYSMQCICFKYRDIEKIFIEI